MKKRARWVGGAGLAMWSGGPSGPAPEGGRAKRAAQRSDPREAGGGPKKAF